MIYRLLLSHGAEFEVLGDSAVAIRYAGADNERERAEGMGIADLSVLPRIGFKGRDTPAWLSTQGLQIPDAPNVARRQSDDGLVLRLSDDEHVILSDLRLASTTVADLERNWQLEPGRMCYHMPRAETHSWFCLSGKHASQMLAKVCGVDLRLNKFADGRIAQTSIARINGVVVRNDLADTPCFHVLTDSTSADFLWPCLMDAMQEFEGAPVGLDCLRSLLA